MSRKEDIIQHINNGYLSKGKSIILGGTILDEEALSDAYKKTPLKALNRHSLIAGGTGKTKTIQILSEHLSSFGIPVLMMDIKADFSGITKEREDKSFITEHHTKINIAYKTVELMSLSEQSGVRLRSTVFVFGPVSFQEFSI